MDLHQPQNNPPSAEGFGIVPNAAASFGKVPQAAAGFGTVRKDAESFRNVPQLSKRTENHTLTVREVSRMFEAAGVARTERSIVNWCQRNSLGAAKLDAYFDPNERKYFVTHESVEVAIAEEQAKAEKHGPEAEGFGKIPYPAETPQPSAAAVTAADTNRLKTLEAELLDLKITNRGKDFFIDQLKQEREGFAAERQEYVSQLMSFNRRVGELETKLLQIEAPDGLPSEDQRAIS